MTTEGGSLPRLDPRLDEEERDELRCLDYLARELEAMRRRGLLAESAFATVSGEAAARRGAIERRGLARAEADEARRLRGTDPRTAAARAEQAIGNDPYARDAWELAVELRQAIGDLDRAEALCEMANDRFPDFPVRADALRRRREEAADADRVDPLAEAHAALRRGDDAAVIATCEARLADHPDEFDALVLLAFSRQRRGENAEALRLYRRIAAMQPENPVWGRWVETVARRPGAETPEAIERPARVAAPVAPVEPRLSWSSVAGEFLQDHWQKLILCLAVLLIVVSSNVGAYQLLGPRIWSPAGKTVLALIYTSMFAAFGTGLTRWGAARAGRIMLLTTLIVVPANFMLAGEIKLLSDPSPEKLALVGLVAAVLLLLCRGVAGVLGVRRGAWGLAAAFVLLGAFNAAATPGVAWPPGGQAALLLAPSLLFLGSVRRINGRYADEAAAAGVEEGVEFVFGALGLFAFAFGTGIARTGGFVLHLAPALYALPAMVAALATIDTARAIRKLDPDPARAATVRYLGVVLSGLAFALALARPPGPSALYSGNVLATALIGLALYAALLVRVRHPAYLYLGFGALVAAYFGAFYFVVDLIRAVEEAARQALGYRRPLPQPFKAINGLVFNVLLAALALTFRRAWGDARLARHCHLIGLPLSVACCLISALEPKAGVICLSGYTLLYALAVLVFGEPRLIYLSAAALAGSGYLATGLPPGMSVGGRALLASGIGLAEWGVGALLARRGAEARYRKPLADVALAMSLLAVAGALASVFTVDGRLGSASTTAAGALAVAALTAGLLNRDRPSRGMAYLVGLSASTSYAFFVLTTGDRWGGLTWSQLAVAAGSAGVATAAVAAWAARRVEWSSATEALAVYPAPLAQVSPLQTTLTVAFAAVHLWQRLEQGRAIDDLNLAGAGALAGVAFALLTRPHPYRALSGLALACWLGAWVAAARAWFGVQVSTVADHAAVCSGFALALLAAGEALRAPRRRKPSGDDRIEPLVPRGGLFVDTIPAMLAAVVAGAMSLVLWGGENGPPTVAALAMGGLAMLGVARWRPSAWMADAGVLLGLVAVVCLTAWRLDALPWDRTVGWLLVVASTSILGLWAIGRVARGHPTGRFYVGSCERVARAAAWAPAIYGVIALGPFGDRNYPQVAGSLGLTATALACLAWTVPSPRLSYRAIFSAVLAVYVVVFHSGKASPETAHVPGLVAVLWALGLEAIALLGRWRRPGEPDRIYWRPAVWSALVLNVLGSLAAHWSVGTMLLAATAFLVLVKAMASRNWIYPALLACGSALSFGYLQTLPPDRLVTAAMVVAYQLWLLGMVVRRYDPWLVSLLRLPQRGHDRPFLVSALGAACLAAGLRSLEILDGGSAWSDSAALLLNLAVFSAFMARAYPHPGWVHGAVVLASGAAGVAAWPRIEHASWWLALGMGLALGWRIAGRLAAAFGSRLGTLLRVRGTGARAVLERWSRAFFVVSGTSLGVTIGVLIVSAAYGLEAVALWSGSAAAWWGVLAALGIGLAYAWASRDILPPLEFLALNHAMFSAAVACCAVPGSPLMAWTTHPATAVLPPVVAALALATVGGGMLLVRRPGLLAWLSGGSTAATTGADDPLSAYLHSAGASLAVFAAFLTALRPGSVTAATFAVSAAALGLVSVARRWILAAYLSGALAGGAGAWGALEALRRLSIASGPDRVVVVGLGLLAVVALLWWVAGLLRRSEPDSFSAEQRDDPLEFPAPRVSLAFEQVALVLSIFCASGIASTLFLREHPADRAAMVAVGELFGLALVAVGLLRRWGATWLVHAAQVILVGAYLYYRWAFPIPAMTDALILTLFGFVAYGLAEAMRAAGLGRYATATGRFVLVLPLLPLALGRLDPRLDEANLLIVFGAATFYGTACYRLQSRSIGYAAAVLYNAGLWFLWWRVGWTVADRPQFFLVPVGLSAILLAEVNRPTFPRQVLNLIRGVGLATIYLSLAVPIWESRSLGAWVGLLFASLAGIFAGIGLRVQTFLWLGLAGFVLDVVYQLGRVGAEHTLAKWAIMLSLGICMVLFVALNEKKQIVATLRGYYDEARGWE